MGLEFGSDDDTLLNEDDRDALRIQTIETKEDLNEFEQNNIEKAVEWTLRKRFGEEIFTEDFVKELHSKMFNDVWKWAGHFRRSDTNLGVHWPKIPSELRQLLDDAKYWVKNQSYTDDEIAIRLKHRIVSIHCFPNGNGRHSRLLADIVINNVFNLPVFNWGGKSLFNAGESKAEYISALRSADEGNYMPLIAFARS